MKQIHVDVDPKFWNALLAKTVLWPKEQRTQVGICRYALLELYAETRLGRRPLGAPAIPPGAQHLQVKTADPDEAAGWAYLADIHGSYMNALKVALAHLYYLLDAEKDTDGEKGTPIRYFLIGIQ